MRRAVPLVLVLLVAACSFVVYEQQESDTLYFGTAKQHGGIVSDGEWQQFLDDVVSPRFPGFTHWKAQGEWMKHAEETHVLVIVHRKGHEGDIREIVAEGKRRLDQSDVLVVRTDVWLPRD